MSHLAIGLFHSPHAILTPSQCQQIALSPSNQVNQRLEQTRVKNPNLTRGQRSLHPDGKAPPKKNNKPSQSETKTKQNLSLSQGQGLTADWNTETP